MSGGAKWRAIAGDIRAKVASGELAPGDPVPSEDVLAARHGVARMTARTALQHLEQTALVTPAQPGGSRTVARRELFTVSLTRAAERVGAGESPTRGADAWLGDMRAAGREPSQDILVIMALAGADAARHLMLPEGVPVVARQLVREAGGTRHNMITFWFPQDIAHGTVLAEPGSIEEGSLAWLEQKFGPLSHTIELTTRQPTADEAKVLSIPAGVPVMVVWRTSAMQGGLPVVAAMAIYPGDRSLLRLDL